MGRFVMALLPAGLLAGCAGYAIDYVKPKESILDVQLARYGLGAAEAQCVGGRLTGALSVWQLRQLERIAASVTEAERRTPRDLLWVASQLEDKKISAETVRAAEACGIGQAAAPRAAPAPSGPSSSQDPAAAPAQAAPAPDSIAPVPAAPAAEAVVKPATWLNLGAAGDKRTISVDASTIERDGPYRRAWFKIVDPAEPAKIISYLIRMECPAKRFNLMALRRHDAAGVVLEENIYGPNGAGSAEVPAGSVTEIAYLSLCT